MGKWVSKIHQGKDGIAIHMGSFYEPDYGNWPTDVPLPPSPLGASEAKQQWGVWVLAWARSADGRKWSNDVLTFVPRAIQEAIG